MPDVLYVRATLLTPVWRRTMQVAGYMSRHIYMAGPALSIMNLILDTAWAYWFCLCWG